MALIPSVNGSWAICKASYKKERVISIINSFTCPIPDTGLNFDCLVSLSS